MAGYHVSRKFISPPDVEQRIVLTDIIDPGMDGS